MVNGSFGEAWAPRRNKTNISMYITDICRLVQNFVDYYFNTGNQIFFNADR